MNWDRQRAAFRAVLTGNRCIHPGSVFDPASARFAESLGYEMGIFTGSLAALAVIGAPDLTLVTLTEFAEQAYRICRAGKLPVLADADHGYGNALNVMRTVEELENAGVGALTIEDSLLPRPFGNARTQLIPVDETVGKLKAALRARQDPGLVIAGRSIAPSHASIEETVARARAYEQTGIDAIYFAGVTTREQVEAIAAAVNIPIMLGYIPPELVDAEYLASKKVRVALQGHHQPMVAGLQAVYATLKGLREGAAPETMPPVVSKDLSDAVMHRAEYAAFTKEFLES